MATRRRASNVTEPYKLDMAGIEAGYYTDAYFNFTRQLLLAEDKHPQVTMQVFQRNDVLLAGMERVLDIFRSIPTTVELFGLQDGNLIQSGEPVLHIKGDYAEFAHLETPILGVLARSTLIANNVRSVVQAAASKPVMFFPARHEFWRTQEIDGYAAKLGGATSVSTNAQGHGFGADGSGTIPHALIAAYGGNTVAAAEAFAKRYKKHMPITVLVDFDNDCVNTAVAVADALGDDLYAVRLDTSSGNIDRSVYNEWNMDITMPGNPQAGVCPALVRLVRTGLNKAGHENVKIVVSGGFTAEKISNFEQLSRSDPVYRVDAYGVGSSLLRGSNDFTADIVEVDGKPCAKVGRALIESDRLKPIDIWAS